MKLYIDALYLETITFTSLYAFRLMNDKLKDKKVARCS